MQLLTGSRPVDIIADAEELRETYGAQTERSLKKQMSRFDKHSREFIACSPFLVIAPTDRLGPCDAWPKGDAPGFVQVIDDTTLLIPDRLGNNRVDTPGNLVARLGIGLIFFVPGINETLRAMVRRASPPITRCSSRLRSTARSRAAASWCQPRRSIFTAARP
jgi:predicted pyridoxine 5'-phosphate oxidase superfamily flavin-nucleotide-binding protein